MRSLGSICVQAGVPMATALSQRIDMDGDPHGATLRRGDVLFITCVSTADRRGPHGQHPTTTYTDTGALPVRMYIDV